MLRLLFLLAVFPEFARAAGEIAVQERRPLPVERQGEASHTLSLTLVHFTDGGWQESAIVTALRDGARILGQCGVSVAGAELVRLEAPARYRYLDMPASRELVRALPVPRPALFFVLDTREQPAFDAEAIGRGNSRTRPELADTVWITHGARDPGIVLAHELAHVLMDSGEHSAESGNLMRDETAPGNTRLTPAQCTRLRETGTANGLLQPKVTSAR